MKSFRLLLTLLLTLALTVGTALAGKGDPTGYWKTVADDNTSQTSIIKIEKRGNKLYGKLVHISDPQRRDAKCTECSGKRKNQPVLGMEIMRDLAQDGDEWSGGFILDPRSGEEYKCKVEVQAGGKKLDVRGYLGIALLGRTQTWTRTSAPKTRR